MNRIGNSMLTKQIWERIVALGSARGLNTNALSEATHISSARIHAFAEGADVIHIDDLAAFSQALGMPIAEMLDGIDIDTA